jgi:hypothetical protein
MNPYYPILPVPRSSSALFLISYVITPGLLSALDCLIVTKFNLNKQKILTSDQWLVLTKPTIVIIRALPRALLSPSRIFLVSLPRAAMPTSIPRRSRRTVGARATGNYHLPIIIPTMTMLFMINWRVCFWTYRGGFGEEVVDEDFSFTNARRRSNSSSISHHISDFKTKFEVNDPEPVFEESVHGPVDENGDDLSKTDSSESGRSST